jgi:hypothetical protein
MNTRPILDSDTGPFVLSVSFNADCSHFSAALESGFRGRTRAHTPVTTANVASILVYNMRREDCQRYLGFLHTGHSPLTRT